VRHLTIIPEHFPLARDFIISRGAKSVADIVVAEIREGNLCGRGEAVPYRRYGETPATVLELMEGVRREIEAGLGRVELQNRLPPGAARNALDCALWDLDAKRASRRAWEIAGIPAPGIVQTAYTLSLGTPENMALAARRFPAKTLKLKLAGDDMDVLRVRSVAAAARESRLILDANEGFSPEDFAKFLENLPKENVALIEQPLRAGEDLALADLPRHVPIAADESCRSRADLTRLIGLYDVINIKLDKTGGLTEALALADDARRLGFRLMIGCMVATSLAMAPALLLAPLADFVDLDGPILLAHDRSPGLTINGLSIAPPEPHLWG
jgi:L-alanine-DL-glutamate epimerase-like enolase superfamily enzyme